MSESVAQVMLMVNTGDGNGWKILIQAEVMGEDISAIEDAVQDAVL